MPFPYPRNQVDHQISETELIPRKEAKLRFRDQIMLSWDYACAYCRAPLGVREATLDHVVPKAKGGLTVKQNLVACCLQCNAAKQHADWQDWLRDQAFHSLAGEDAIHSWINS
jgi:5-methylcytosine-specific restriction endonuclease McrA